MKINKLWIPMILFGIIGGAAKICDTMFNVNGVGFIVNSDICSAAFIASIVLVWLIGVIMLLADRKVEVELTPPKSKATGFFGFISAVSILGSGIISLFSLGNTDLAAGTIIIIILGILGGLVMLYESCVSFTGHNGMTKMPLATLFLPAWACGRLISLFIQYSKVSIHATEMFDVISVTFLMLFLFYQAMLFAEIGPRTAVRRSALYGICYVMCGLITTVDILIKMFSPTPETGGIDVFVVEPTLGRILICVTDLAFVFYAASFVISNARNAVLDRFDEDDEYDDPEFLGAISEDHSKPAPQEPVKKKSKAKKPEKPAAKPKPVIRFEDKDEDEDEYGQKDTKSFGGLKIEEEYEYDKPEDTVISEEKPAEYEADIPEENVQTELEDENTAEENPVSVNTPKESDVYMFEDSQEDYDEIFRMLDEMGSNDE